ncbi:dispersed gene family protein 1 (DGF-1), putative, partial [Trypanosoma cruzi]
MLTCASKKRRLDYWRAAISPPLFRATTTTLLDALDGYW